MALIYRDYGGSGVRRGTNLIASIISLIGGIIVTLLGLRFVLALLGANPANAFASFIYNTSHTVPGS